MAARRTLHAITAQTTPAAPAPLYRGIELSVPEDTALPGALCRQVHPDTFFPHPDDTATAENAKAICGMCPARAACLAWALARGESVGIWGGTTPAERDELLERRGRCGTYVGYSRSKARRAGVAA
jgi:WhiB family redox-sensing transcriptional regulator